MSAGDKPVILVLMHHTHEAKNATSVRSCDDFSNLVLHVSVFYHDTMHGLLNCHQNDEAVSEIQRKLLEYSIIKSKDTSGNTQRMAADTAGLSVTNGGNEMGSDGSSMIGMLALRGLWRSTTK